MSANWCNAASIRRAQIETGADLTFCEVFVPYFVEKISQLKPKAALEIGAGTGHMVLHLSKYCGEVLAIEPSLRMYQTAQEVLKNDRVVSIQNISFEEIDSHNKFDFIYSHMCLQAIDNLVGFFDTVSTLLSNKGIAIMTLPHPCFYNGYKNFFSSEEYNYMMIKDKMISFSISKDPTNLIDNVPYHHRPLSKYVEVISSNNLNLVAFDEIYPSLEIQNKYGMKWDVPRYCSFILSRKSS